MIPDQSENRRSRAARRPAEREGVRRDRNQDRTREPAIASAGSQNVESASFVSPKWVPQMADGAAVMAGIERRPGTIYSVLTPNLRGFEGALEAKADEIVIFGAASEAFSQKNINCSIAESIARFEPVAKAAKEAGVRLRGSISCSLGCPYQGEVTVASVVDVVERMKALGCDEIDIADTIGVGTPQAHARSARGGVEGVSARAPLRATFTTPTDRPSRNIYAALPGRHRDLPRVGGGARRLSVCEGRDRQRRDGRRRLPDERARHRDGRRSRSAVEIGDFISRAIGKPSSSRAGRASAREETRRRDALRLNHTGKEHDERHADIDALPDSARRVALLLQERGHPHAVVMLPETGKTRRKRRPASAARSRRSRSRSCFAAAKTTRPCS